MVRRQLGDFRVGSQHSTTLTLLSPPPQNNPDRARLAQLFASIEKLEKSSDALQADAVKSTEVARLRVSGESFTTKLADDFSASLAESLSSQKTSNELVDELEEVTVRYEATPSFNFVVYCVCFTTLAALSKFQHKSANLIRLFPHPNNITISCLYRHSY